VINVRCCKQFQYEATRSASSNSGNATSLCIVTFSINVWLVLSIWLEPLVKSLAAPSEVHLFLLGADKFDSGFHPFGVGKL